MQPATLKQRMFRTAFDCDRAERAALIDFMKFLSDNDVQDTLPNHPLGPSSAWLWWGGESFIGFGPSRVLLQTGPGTTVRLVNQQIAEKRQTPLSLMPAGLIDRLKDQEIADLYAYLKGLSRSPR